MKTLLDVHTHTIASGHAFCTLQEMTLAAKEKGLEILGITEHGPNIPGTCINAMRNPYIQIISHPGDGTAELDFEQLMKVSKETHTLLEINNHSMAPIRHKTVAAPNNLQLLELAKKYETPVIFGSDAHFSTMIADYENIMPLAKKCDFPEELVLNYSPEKFLAYIKPMPE